MNSSSSFLYADLARQIDKPEATYRKAGTTTRNGNFQRLIIVPYEYDLNNFGYASQPSRPLKGGGYRGVYKRENTQTTQQHQETVTPKRLRNAFTPLEISKNFRTVNQDVENKFTSFDAKDLTLYQPKSDKKRIELAQTWRGRDSDDNSYKASC